MELAFSRWVAAHPWRVLVSALLVVMAAANGARYLTFNNNHRLYFSPDNPELLAFNALENTFVKNDTVTFVVAPADGHVFTRDTLTLIHALTTRVWQLPFCNRVDSITNFQATRAHGDALEVRDLVADPAHLTPSAIAEIKAIALAEPLLNGALLSADARVTAVNAVVQMPRLDEAHEVPTVVEAARTIAADFERTHPGLKIYLTGVVMMDHAFAEAALKDSQSLVPLSFVAMLGLVALLLGRVMGTLATVCVIGLATASAMGVAGYLNYPVSFALTAAPVIILTVAIANCVHLLESYLTGLQAGLAKQAAIVASLHTNLKPIFFASVTTVIGFLSFNFSDVPPFRQLGNVVAFGDFASYCLAITLFPALLALLPTPAPRRSSRLAAWNAAVGEFVIRNSRRLCVGLGLVIAGLAACISRNELNDVFVHYFDHSIEFRRATDFTVANLTGVYHFYYTLDSGVADGINEPGFLNETAAFTAWLRTQPEIRHVASYSDTIQRLNKNLHADDPSYYRLPESRELAAQYLLLYEMSLPYGLDLNNQINVDKSALKISVAVNTISTRESLALNARAEGWIKAHASHIKSGVGSGTALMFTHLGKRNIESMLVGSAVALVLISVLLLCMLRSWKLGLISLIPNLAPLVMGFGVWGLCVGQVGLSLSVVSSMTLGVIIDDTVHFLVKYQRAMKAGVITAAEAIRQTHREVGPATLVTTLVLVTGFLILSRSHFEINAGMGLLTAIVIAFAWVADLFFLAPCLLLLDRRR